MKYDKPGANGRQVAQLTQSAVCGRVTTDTNSETYLPIFTLSINCKKCIAAQEEWLNRPILCEKCQATLTDKELVDLLPNAGILCSKCK